MTDDVVVVDLGGVAARYLPQRRLVALERSTGLSSERLQRELFESGLDHRAEHGEYTTDQLVDEILARLEHTIDTKTLVEAWSECFEPAEPMMQSLDSHRGATALFTNNGPMIDLCLAGPLRTIRDRFDTIICSWHLGAVKPDRIVFNRAATRLQRPPRHLLLLDDDPTNVTAARQAGWRAAHETATTQFTNAITAAP